MNNENKNTNVGTNNVTSNTTNIPSVGSVPFNGVSPVNQGLSEINTSPVTPQIVSNPTEIPEMTAPTTPQIVNDPTAALKGVDSSTISTTSDAPRITDTAVEATTHNHEQNNAGAMVNEKLKKVEVEYKPPSKFKIGLMLFFFVLILAFIIFLPEVTQYMSDLFDKKDKTVIEITTGKLVCKLDSTTANLDKNYVRTFQFTDNKIEKVTFKTTTRGDITQDEATLNELNKQCTDIREGLESLTGASIECDYQNGKLVETEKFDLATYDYEQTSAAYTEAGADMLKFDNGEDVDKVKTSMLQAGFSCEKMD